MLVVVDSKSRVVALTELEERGQGRPTIDLIMLTEIQGPIQAHLHQQLHAAGQPSHE
jgi:hypothetical protein